MRTVLSEVREFDGRAVPFLVKEVPRARSIRIRVTHEGVVVTKPYRVPRYEVEAFVEHSHKWIIAQIDEMGTLAQKTLSDRIHYLGEVREIRRASVPPVRFSGDVFWAPGEDAAERLEAVLEWMRRRAKPVLRDSVYRWSSRMCVTVRRMGVRDQTSRWGSCSSAASVSFNWRLVMAPQAVLEYIVVHELAHILEHNHSDRFWRVVETHCPDYEACEKWLDEHGPELLQYGRGMIEVPLLA
ncbi:MAG TPA: SprT family zinc-dependent metalloprotease [Fimbriimonadaceae bacterium]|nr:SprT family zinc-dependent metalloprotease [Fimbriimonadaceae bacterium]